MIAGVALAGLAADVVTKWLAVTYLDPARPIPLLGGLVTLQLTRNPGAAFSMGQNVTIVFSLLAVVALIFVVGWLAPRVRVRSWAIATGLVIAGIAGNFLDRVFRAPGFLIGHVVDFIQLPYFAIFNVADMCLTFGAAIILLVSIGSGISYDGTRSGSKRSDTASAKGSTDDESVAQAPESSTTDDSANTDPA